MGYDFLYRVDDGVATLTFNRPEVLNALTFEIYAQARFAFLFTRAGLTGADMGAAYLLPRVVGLGRAAEVLLFGDTLDASTAERYGLVNRVVPHDQLLPAAVDWARRLASGPTQAIGMTKRMLNNELHLDLISALEAEAQAQALMLLGEDHRIFYQAFKDKVDPRFVGR
jgi:enoyl-CoA hydratase/carnithine racemase